jgi:hypothetical protein
MAQSAAADLPPHQGLFNLAGAPASPAPAPAARFPGAAPTGRIEPRLVASNPAPAPKPATSPARPALALAPAAAAPAKSIALPGGNAQVQPKPVAPPARVQPSGEPISRGRFLKKLEHFAKTEEAKAIGSAVARARARSNSPCNSPPRRARVILLAWSIWGRTARP